MVYVMNRDDYLAHHGILGMKWGKRQGPPYPLDGKQHSAAEKKAGWQKSINRGTKTYDNNSPTYESDKQRDKRISRNVQNAYVNIKKHAGKYEAIAKREQKGKKISEKQKVMQIERKKILDAAIKQIDKETIAKGQEFVNKAMSKRQTRDCIVGSVAATVMYNAGLAAMVAVGVPVPKLPKVIPIPDIKAAKATKYIRENRSY